MDYQENLAIQPGKRSRKPGICGTRTAVTDVLDYLAGGMTQDNLLKEFPDLTSENIRACLAFSANREWKLAALPE